jgi:hypothetical protein
MKNDTKHFVQFSLEGAHERSRTQIGFFSYHAISWLITQWKCRDRIQAKDWLFHLFENNKIKGLDSDDKTIKFGTYFYYFYDAPEMDDEDHLDELDDYVDGDDDADELRYNLIELKFPESRYF